MNFTSSKCGTYSSMYFHLSVFRFFFFLFSFTMLFTFRPSQGIERDFLYHCKFSDFESKQFTCDSVYKVVLIMLIYISQMYNPPHSDLSISHDQHVAYGNLLKTKISSVINDHFAPTNTVGRVIIVKICKMCNATCLVQIFCSHIDVKKEMSVSSSFFTIQGQIHTQSFSLYSSFMTGKMADKLTEMVINNLTFHND